LLRPEMILLVKQQKVGKGGDEKECFALSNCVV